MVKDELKFPCEVTILLLTDETALIVNSYEKLNKLKCKLGKIYKRLKLKISVGIIRH